MPAARAFLVSFWRNSRVKMDKIGIDEAPVRYQIARERVPMSACALHVCSPFHFLCAIARNVFFATNDTKGLWAYFRRPW